MKDKQNIFLVIAVVIIVAAIMFLQSVKPEKKAGTPSAGIPVKEESSIIKQKERQYQRAKEIVNPSGFVNTDKITINELIGKKVIMVLFWTYSCINCERETPYINAWYDKYHDKGLEIIGVHTPEFEFEKVHSNVVAAVKKYGIKYPVVQDNNYATWIAYGNQYWPRKYLIDIDGFIAYDQIGEGNYDDTEREIQKLLGERDKRLGVSVSVPSDIANPKVVEMDTFKVKSPETYFGSSRNDLFGNGNAHIPGVQTLSLPNSFNGDTFYLNGKWAFYDQYAESVSPGAIVVYNYNAKNVYLVASADEQVKVKVLKDGKPLGADAGLDIGLDSSIYVKEARMYKLIEGLDYGTHTIELIIEKPGLKAFTFTFG